MAETSEHNQAESREKEQPEQVRSLFRKPTKNKNIRKRTIDEGEDEDEDEDNETKSSILYHVKRTSKPEGKLYFSTGESKQLTSGEPVEEPKNALFLYESSKEIQVHNDSRATATLETEREFSRDARAIRERALKQAEEALKGKNKTSGDKKLYRAIHGYTDYKAGLRQEQIIASEKAGGAHGPLRASAHVRLSARFDYQAEIC